MRGKLLLVLRKFMSYLLRLHSFCPPNFFLWGCGCDVGEGLMVGWQYPCCGFLTSRFWITFHPFIRSFIIRSFHWLLLLILSSCILLSHHNTSFIRTYPPPPCKSCTPQQRRNNPNCRSCFIISRHAFSIQFPSTFFVFPYTPFSIISHLATNPSYIHDCRFCNTISVVVAVVLF